MSKWTEIRLGDVAVVMNGKTPSGNQQRNEGYPVLKVRDVDAFGRFRGSFDSFIDSTLAARYAERRAQLGDTLILNAAHNSAYVASKVYRVEPAVAGAHVTGEWLIVRPNTDALDSRFVSHWMGSTQTRGRLRDLVKGIHLYPRDVAGLKLPIPALHEQRRIVDVLDRADSLRVKRREVLARLDELTRSIFFEMFGDPLVESSRFDRVPLALLGQLDRGISKHRPRNDPRLLGGRYPLIQTGDVARSGGYIENHDATYSEQGLAQSKMWPRGTLCITIAANIAKAGILEFDACFPDSVVGFVADPNTTEFVRVWLSFLQEHLESMAPESAQKNINLAILRTLMIPRPPVQEIAEFGARIRSVRILRLASLNHLRQSDALSEALRHRAFRGEL